MLIVDSAETAGVDIVTSHLGVDAEGIVIVVLGRSEWHWLGKEDLVRAV